MAQINLLPWREKARQEKKVAFATKLGISIGVTILLIILIHLLMTGLINREKARNNFLQEQLGERTAQFRALMVKKQQQDAMAAELNFIYSLRNNSYAVVDIMNQLAVIVPSAVTLTKVVKENKKLLISGKSRSELDITAFMKNIKGSPAFTQPTLTRISETSDKTTGVSRLFEIQVDLTDRKPS